jgi:3,4-dihydroxy 2-butanone 4-phosphate synthase/GTP cyclohydrolase II
VTLREKSGVIPHMSRLSQFLTVFKQTKLSILVDDLSSSRAALVAPAQDITPEQVNRILTISGGLTFVALSPERAAAFLLSTMTRPSSLRPQTLPVSQMAQYVSVEAREGITTGISAADRAKTLHILGAAIAQPRALVKPGHIFPVETRSGGVLVKTAIPEGALDVVTMIEATDAALFVDLLTKDGELMTERQAEDCARQEQLPLITLSELIRYRLQQESLVQRVAEASLPTTLAGEVRAIVYRSHIGDIEHVALVKGDVRGDTPVLVRVQAEHTVPDVFGGSSPATRSHLQNSLREIGERERGILLYLRRPFMDPKGSAVQHLKEPPTSPSARRMREYGVGAQILRDLGVTHVELLTSSTNLLEGLPSFGITVIAQHTIPQHLSTSGHTV